MKFSRSCTGSTYGGGPESFFHGFHSIVLLRGCVRTLTDAQKLPELLQEPPGPTIVEVRRLGSRVLNILTNNLKRGRAGPIR